MGSFVRVEPDLDTLFAHKRVNLKKAVLMNDLYWARGRVPYIQILVPQERLNIIFCYRAGKPVHAMLPSGKGRNRILEYRRHSDIVFTASPDKTIYLQKNCISFVSRYTYLHLRLVVTQWHNNGLSYFQDHEIELFVLAKKRETYN